MVLRMSGKRIYKKTGYDLFWTKRNFLKVVVKLSGLIGTQLKVNVHVLTGKKQQWGVLRLQVHIIIELNSNRHHSRSILASRTLCLGFTCLN